MALFPTNATQVQQFAGALYGVQIGSTTLAQVTSDIQAAGGLNNALNAYYTASFGTSTTASVAAAVTANLGLTGTAATAATDYITAVLNSTAANARGAAIEGVLNMFSNLTADATFGAAATAWNAKVATAASYTGAGNLAIGTVVATVAPFTVNTDALVGTTSDDTFSGVAATTSPTFSITDSLDGGAGNDTLNLTIDTLAANSVPAVQVKNVETINVRNVSGNAQTVDLANFSGETTFNNTISTGALTVSNAPAGVVAGISGNGTSTNGATTLGFLASATGAATLNISGGTTAGAVTVTGTGITSTVVNSTGAANILGGLTTAATSKTLTINATTGLVTGALATGTETSYVITGTAATGPTATAANVINPAVTIGAVSSVGATIDASGMSAGGVGVTLVAATSSFKGGQGSDVVTTATLTNTAASIIDAGAGTDVLTLAAYADVATAAKAKQYANFEIVDSAALTGTTLDMSLFTNSTITGVASGAATAPAWSNLTAAQAGNITIYGSQATTTTIGVKDATLNGNIDTVTLNFNDGLTAKSTFTLASLVMAGVEKLNVVTNDHATISLLTSSTALTNITVTGSGNTSITTGAVAVNANTQVDASALTGTFTFDATGATANGYKVTGSATKANTLTGAALTDILIGGAGNDTFVTGAGADVVTTGGGADTITVAAMGAGGGVPSSTVFKTITDYSKVAGATFDTINAGTLLLGTQVVAAAAGVATVSAGGVATFNAADTTFAQHLTAVEAALNGVTAGKAVIWQEGADAYLFIQDGTAGIANTDTLVKLVGVTAGAMTITGNAITAMA